MTGITGSGINIKEAKALDWFKEYQATSSTCGIVSTRKPRTHYLCHDKVKCSEKLWEDLGVMNDGYDVFYTDKTH